MNLGIPFGDANRRPPLAERMRPATLAEVSGHAQLLGADGAVRLLAKPDHPANAVFWGPPGTGKTTLARLVASEKTAHFEPFSAVLGGVKEIREIVQRAKDRLAFKKRPTLLFIDEIHRFNKGQQDALLPHVEDGTIWLLGATTENPAFALNNALLSRCKLVAVKSLRPEDVVALLERAISDTERGLGRFELPYEHEGLMAIARACDGDARRGLNMLEDIAGHVLAQSRTLDANLVATVLERPVLRHDRDGDAHYDVISAFIKSMRGSCPDAALYYLARMILVGEDPRFICRRMVIFASEDVGNADPRALSVALDTMQAVGLIGMPEGRIIMAQAVTYLASAPKSNASYLGINRAMEVVRATGTLPVPNHLKNTGNAVAEEMGHGEGYLYPHDHGGWVDETYLPEAVASERFYAPQASGYERHLAERLARLRNRVGSDEPGTEHE